MLTRRQMLLAGGAVVLAGVGVAVAEADDPRVRRVLHQVGLADSPDHSVPDAHVATESGTLTSAHMPHPVGWTIASPATTARGVVYCLHGHANDHRQAFRDGALLAAERAPDRFAAVVASSPALWTDAGATPAIAFDGAADYHRNDVFAGVDRLASLEARVDCGTDDPFYDAARMFVSRLPHPNPGSFGEGFHDAAYWRSVAPAQVATIGHALLT